MGKAIKGVLLAALCGPAVLNGQTTINGGRSISGIWDAGNAVSTRPAKLGSALPGTCTVGEMFFKIDAVAGANLQLCTAANTWTQISGGSGSGAAGSNGQLQYNSSGSLAGSACTYDGGTQSIVCPGGFSTTGSGATELSFAEGTAPSAPVTPFTLTLYQDSADHKLKYKLGDNSVTALGNGDVSGPAANTADSIPQWNGANSKTLKDGLSVVTTLGNPGTNTAVPTEAAVRAAIAGAGGGDVSGPASSTDGHLASFSGTTGKLIQDSGKSMDTLAASSFGITIDGGGSAITAGVKGYKRIPVACTISAWSLVVKDGTVTVDVLKIASGSSLPTASITASATPAISSGNATRSGTLTGWTTAVAANDIVGFQVTGTPTSTWAELTVECAR